MGAQPLANAWPQTPQELPRYPLRLMACRECAHCQQAIALAPHLLYEHYPYVSGTSQTLDDYFRRFAERAEKEHGGETSLRVLDIGGNDGTLLKHFQARGHGAVSVDPARNLKPLAEEKGIETHAAFWSEDFARNWGRSFDVITAVNVLAHVASPYDFLKGCREALAEGGMILAQTSYANMLANGEFDTIYHEHHSFFQTDGIRRLAERSGLKLLRARHSPVYGTSHLWTLGLAGEEEESVRAMIAAEKEKGFYDMAHIRRFAAEARKRAEAVRVKLQEAEKEGFTLAGFGAGTKICNFLNFLKTDLRFLADESPLKQGRFMPGRNIPVVSAEEAWAAEGRVFWFIGAWNFREELCRKIRQNREGREDRFLVAFPEVEIFA